MASSIGSVLTAPIPLPPGARFGARGGGGSSSNIEFGADVGVAFTAATVFDLLASPINIAAAYFEGITELTPLVRIEGCAGFDAATPLVISLTLSEFACPTR